MMRPLSFLAFGVLLGLAFGRSAAPLVSAQPRELSFRGSCSREDLVIYEDSGTLRCVSPRELRFPRCDDDEVLGTDTWGALRCVSTSAFYLPACDRGQFLVSEGSGRWRCESR